MPRGTRVRVVGALSLLLVVVVVLLLARGGSGPAPTPGPSAGRALRADAKDQLGHQLSGLSVVPDPESGGYLGVYYWPTGTGPADFAVGLARSDDLLTWRNVAELDADGGNMPTLRRTPGGGYLLAYEDYVRVRKKNAISRIRVRAYADRASLLRNTWSVQRELPPTLSRNNEGTPSFDAVRWGGSPRDSTIRLRFHYNAAGKGIDRQGVGTLEGFSRWTSRRDDALDATLAAAGFPGSHGRRAEFAVGGRPWMLIEAQRRAGDFSSWRLVLLDRGPRPAAPRVVCGGVPRAPGVGVPSVAVLPAPGGADRGADGPGGTDDAGDDRAGRGGVLFASGFVFGGPTGGPFASRRPFAGVPGALRTGDADVLAGCAPGG